MIKIEWVPAFNDNYIWLVTQPPANKVAIVDPGDSTPVLNKLAADQLEPCAILLTHHHPDHVGGVDELLQHFDVPVYGPATESIVSRTHPVAEGDIVALDALDAVFSVLDVPGHTAGAVAYHGHGVAFTGDTLFLGGCGRLFEGTAAEMHASLGKLAALPESTEIYCGHEYTLANLAFAEAVEGEDNPAISQRVNECKMRRQQEQPTVPGNLEQEKRTNPFLRTGEESVRLAASQYAGRDLADEVEVLAAIRNWKDNFRG